MIKRPAGIRQQGVCLYGPASESADGALPSGRKGQFVEFDLYSLNTGRIERSAVLAGLLQADGFEAIDQPQDFVRFPLERILVDTASLGLGDCARNALQILLEVFYQLCQGVCSGEIDQGQALNRRFDLLSKRRFLGSQALDFGAVVGIALAEFREDRLPELPSLTSGRDERVPQPAEHGALDAGGLDRVGSAGLVSRPAGAGVANPVVASLGFRRLTVVRLAAVAAEQEPS